MRLNHNKISCIKLVHLLFFTYGLKHHIPNEYEEKFTTGQGGQARRTTHNV